jgi:hypothetical protein
MNFTVNECGRCGDVAANEAVQLSEPLAKFATLATRLHIYGVAGIPLGRHSCHDCHAKKCDEDNKLKPAERDSIFGWLKIICEEGHIEPSQPLVGRAVGWPQRNMSVKSLWVDFTCWCKTQIIDLPDSELFFSILDQLFIRSEGRYQFPPLETCRALLRDLEKKFECD